MSTVDETLEEGRVALFLLERQLKESKTAVPVPSDSSVGSRQSSLNNERKLLDKVPRDARLTYNRSSLGLTIEEMDDRGLLEGGGSMPNYYTSIRQMHRRPLEMRNRSSRLQERGKEAITKMLNSLFHMLRALAKRGVNVEFFCCDRDPEGRGCTDRKEFMSVLRNLGLPFDKKDLTDLMHRYLIPSTNEIDYVSFFRDCGPSHQFHGSEKITGERGVDLRMYRGILTEVKRMLLESVRSLGKSPDDVYRMFARWDPECVGTVTATQFLRVLARLHIELSDTDQDFLVELLDTNSMGRIDFENLLNFCFRDFVETQSPPNKANYLPDDIMANNDCTFASSEGGKVALLGDGNSTASAGRRPHTASSSRPVEDDSGSGRGMGGGAFDPNATADSGSERSRPQLAAVKSPKKANLQRPMTASARVSSQASHASHLHYTHLSENGRGLGDEPPFVVEFPDDAINDDDNNNRATLTPLTTDPGGGPQPGQRRGGPVLHTAAAHEEQPRTSYTQEPEQHDSTSLNDNTLITDQDEYFPSPNVFERAESAGRLRHQDYGYGSEQDADQGRYFYDRYGNSLDGLTTASSHHTHDSQQTGGHATDWQHKPEHNEQRSHQVNHPPNRLPTREYSNGAAKFGRSPRDRDLGPEYYEPMYENDDLQEYEHTEAEHGTQLTSSLDSNFASFDHHGLPPEQDGVARASQNNGNVDRFLRAVDGVGDGSASDVRGTSWGGAGLGNGAKSIFHQVRELVVSRYNETKNLRDIYHHFDRDGKNFFDVHDFARAAADLCIATNMHTAQLAVAHIAIDDSERARVTMGEFTVYILDPEHRQLERNLLSQLSQQLERQGKEYLIWLQKVFWEEETELRLQSDKSAFLDATPAHKVEDRARRSRLQSQLREVGVVSAKAFSVSLGKLGIKLNTTDAGRLISRFDINANNECSVVRFMRCVDASPAWQHAQTVLAYQEEAIEEASLLREQMRAGKEIHVAGLTEELLAMAEYLGIRAVTEQHLLWIAADALRAPLPVSWSVQKDAKGRTFFYNHISDQSRWDHPLDPHFRKLRDDYRQSEGQAQPRQRDYNTRDSEAVELKLNKAIPIAPTALLSPAPQLTSGQWSASAPQLIITNSGLPSLNPNSNFVPGPGLFGSSKPKQQRNGASSGPKPSSREDRPEVEDLLVLEHVPVVRASKIRPHSAVPEKTGPSRLAELGGAGKLKWHDRPASSTERIPLPLDSTHAHAQNLYDVQHPPADASLRVENGRRGQTRGVPPVTVSPNYIANLLRDRALLEDSAHGSSSLRDKTGAALAVPDGRREQSPEEIYTWTKRIPSAKAHHGGGMGASSSSSGLHASNSSKATTALPVAAGGSTSRSSARPSSAAKVRSVPTAVDRVVALKDVPSHLAPAGIKLRPRDFAAVPSTKDEVTRSQQLAEMFDDRIISKLDCIIVPKNSEGSSARPKSSQQSSKRGKGGIVLL